MNLCAFLSRRLHTTVLACEAEISKYGILTCQDQVLTEIVRVGLVHARHASQIHHVIAAPRVHFEACLMPPAVGNSSFGVVGGPTIADCARIVDATAPLRRGLHAALLRAGGLDDDAVLGILFRVLFAEILWKHANHASCALQRVPPAARYAKVVASSDASVMFNPLDGGVHSPVIRRVSVSNRASIADVRATLRRRLHTTFGAVKAQFGMLSTMFRVAVVLGKNALLACCTTQVITEPAAARVHLEASSIFPTELGANLPVV
jgi:hypothetical protein